MLYYRMYFAGCGRCPDLKCPVGQGHREQCRIVSVAPGSQRQVIVQALRDSITRNLSFTVGIYASL